MIILPNLPSSPDSPFHTLLIPSAEEFPRVPFADGGTQIREVELPASFEIFPAWQKNLPLTKDRSLTQNFPLTKDTPLVQNLPLTEDCPQTEDSPTPANSQEFEFWGFNFELDTPDFANPGLGNGGNFAPLWGSDCSMNDVPPVVILNSYDDEDEDDDMDDVPDEEDDDVYEEVEMFDDFDDDFDEDFEDEFDEDYEDLAKIDDEELDGDEDEGNAVPSRYEEEFGDVDGQAKFIPDGADIGLPEEVLIGEEDLDVNVGSDFDDFDDDEENGVFN